MKINFQLIHYSDGDFWMVDGEGCGTGLGGNWIFLGMAGFFGNLVLFFVILREPSKSDVTFKCPQFRHTFRFIENVLVLH